jgi:hypothetical protein
MSKLAFVSMTLVGAVPSGFTLYLLVQHFVDHGVPQANALGIAVWVTLAALFLVVISPFIVLIRYKAPARVTAPAASLAKGEAGSNKKKAGADDEFGDAIPEDFDEEELAASQPEEESYEDDGGDFDYAEDDIGDFEEEEEEAPKPKAKAKKK